MKKICSVLCLSLLVSTAAIAKPSATLPISPNAKTISIIYIHGADETRPIFEKDVRNVHDDMVKLYQSDPLIYKRLLDNGNKKIAEKEITFFWGDRLEQNVSIVNQALDYAKEFGSKFARFGRTTLSHTLHDAIWVNRPINSRPILNNLNDLVKKEQQQGHEVILYGYSAGSLLASQYMIRKLPTIEVNNLDKAYSGKFFDKTIKKYDFAPTCLDALTESRIIFYTDSDEFVTNPSVSYLKQTFPKLNSYTQKYCAPANVLDGVLVFGTPLTTFDSGASKIGTPSNMLSQFMMKYLVENNIFFLSVNYDNDFISMPMPNKPHFSDFQQSDLLKDIKPNGGFLYDDSGIKTAASILSAHGAYWLDGKRFAKAIVKGYNDGFKYFYNK